MGKNDTAPDVGNKDGLDILLEEMDAEESRLDELIGNQTWNAEGRENDEWYRSLRRAVVAFRPIIERVQARMANQGLDRK